MNESQRCVKCGGTDIYTEWHEGRLYHNTIRVTCAAAVAHGEHPPEHLRFHCRTCQYGWFGPTLDAAAVGS